MEVGQECAIFGLVVLVLMVAVGIVVLVGVGAVLVENVLLRHVHVLQKQALVQYYEVLDRAAGQADDEEQGKERRDPWSSVTAVGVSDSSSTGTADCGVVAGGDGELRHSAPFAAPLRSPSSGSRGAGSGGAGTRYLTHAQHLELQHFGLLAPDSEEDADPDAPLDGTAATAAVACEGGERNVVLASAVV